MVAQTGTGFLEQILKKYPQEELVLTFGSRTFGKYSAVQLEQLLERYPQVKLASSPVSGEAGFSFLGEC